MKTTKIKIKNLFGITETELDGSSVEITGTNGSGKTSVLDAIRLALSNRSERDYVIKNGENEGEILIETDTGLTIDRKKRAGQADYRRIKENGEDVQTPETFLKQIFTPLQLNPVAFTKMDKNEQNRIILDLIDFKWDLQWIRDQFGELPEGVDYSQNILQVLHDIQDEDGVYFKRRQDINRDIRNQKAFIEDIAEDLPENYNGEKWEAVKLADKYKALESIRAENSKIERAKTFKESVDGKIRSVDAEKEIELASIEKSIASEKEDLSVRIEKLKGEIKAAEEKLKGLEAKKADKVKIVELETKEKIDKINKDNKIAEEYAGKEVVDTKDLVAEIEEIEAMKKHINEHKRMKDMQREIELLKDKSELLTSKIELARTLPGEILKTAQIPVKGLTVKDGIPLIHGLPVSNLSEGEQLDLCVDIAISKPNALQIILIDGVEKLSDENREKLYAKCKEKGLQFIATRTNNSSEMEVTKIC